MSAASQAAARRYIERGLAPIPVPAGEKNPNRENWQTERHTLDDVPRAWNNGQNVGLLLGEPSGGLADVDLDVPEAVALAGRFLPPTLTSGREGSPDSHWWYVSADLQTGEWKDTAAKKIVELRGTGRQTLVEPSTHPSGGRYSWSRSGLEMATMDGPALRARCTELATAVLIAHHLPRHRDSGGGGRHDYALALAGFLLRPERLDENLALKILVAAWDAKGWASESQKREAHRDLAGVVSDTAENLADGESVVGGPTLDEMVPGMVRLLCRYWGWHRGEQGHDAGGEGHEWEDPAPLPDGLPPVTSFDPAMLPDALRPWCEDIAERMQVPLDYVAIGAVTVAASLVGRKVGIHPKRKDGWFVVANLWAAIVGPSAAMKSPALAEITKLLDRLVGAAMKAHSEAEESHRAEAEAVEAEKTALKKAIDTAAKKSVETGDRSRLDDLIDRRRNMETSESPTERRYKTSDTTIEKLVEILRDNPTGILIQRDELVGLLRGLDRQGREADRAFYLESWNGTGSYTVDRIGRGTLHVPALCISVLGGIQPGPLRSYVYGATRGGEGADGLLQRFQLLVWPDPPSGAWRNVDRYPDADAKNRAYAVYEALDRLDPEGEAGAKNDDLVEDGGIPAVRFSPDAQEVFDAWRHELEAKLRGEDASEAFVSHLAKYRSLMPSLALIFHLVDAADSLAESSVGVASVTRAAAWCEYLEGHARRVYASGESPALEGARTLLARIRKGDVKDGDKIREVYRGRHWARLSTPEEVFAAAAVLEDHGWLRVEKLDTGGRPTHHLRIHPVLKKEA